MSTHNFEPIIKLNVGGHTFTTTISALTKFPETMLGAMFSGRHALLKDESGAYFIDRDGRNFHYILNFLRSPETFDIGCIPSTTMTELKIEVDYYGLKDLMVTPNLPPRQYHINPQVTTSCISGGGTVTIYRGNNELWYMNHITGPRGSDTAANTYLVPSQTPSQPAIVVVCDNCGLGFPAGFNPRNCGVANFVTGNAVSPAQPRVTSFSGPGHPQFAKCPVCGHD